MTYVSVDATAVRDAIGGRVYVAGESGYEPARLPWQRRLDPRPALIVEAANASDVRTAVRFAREHDLPFAVQSTGHGAVNVPDGGLLLKTNVDELGGDRRRPPRRPGRWRRAVERRDRRRRAARAGAAVRLLADGRRHRLHARRRHRLAVAPVRLRRRQRRARRGRHRRRRARHGLRRARTRTSSGHCAAAAETSAW